MARKVTISFKETVKDIELYEIIMGMDDKSYEVKQILRRVLIEGKVKKKGCKQPEERDEVNVLDF